MEPGTVKGPAHSWPPLLSAEGATRLFQIANDAAARRQRESVMTAGLRPTEPLDYVQNDDETAWLDPDEQDAWQGFLSLNRVVFAALEAQLQSQCKMPLAYYAILVTLSEAPDRTLRMGELARKLYAAPSSISHA